MEWSVEAARRYVSDEMRSWSLVHWIVSVGLWSLCQAVSGAVFTLSWTDRLFFAFSFGLLVLAGLMSWRRGWRPALVANWSNRGVYNDLIAEGENLKRDCLQAEEFVTCMDREQEINDWQRRIRRFVVPYSNQEVAREITYLAPRAERIEGESEQFLATCEGRGVDLAQHVQGVLNEFRAVMQAVYPVHSNQSA